MRIAQWYARIVPASAQKSLCRFFETGSGAVLRESEIRLPSLGRGTNYQVLMEAQIKSFRVDKAVVLCQREMRGLQLSQSW